MLNNIKVDKIVEDVKVELTNINKSNDNEIKSILNSLNMSFSNQSTLITQKSSKFPLTKNFSTYSTQQDDDPEEDIKLSYVYYFTFFIYSFIIVIRLFSILCVYKLII